MYKYKEKVEYYWYDMAWEEMFTSGYGLAACITCIDIRIY